MKIRTHFVYPPIPIRDYDWSAVDDDTYEGGCPISSGRTEQAAVLDLIERLELEGAWPLEVASAVCPVFRAITE